MYVDMRYGTARVAVTPDRIEIKDRLSDWGSLTLMFSTVEQYDDLIRVLQENRTDAVKMLAGREPVDGCICGQPDLPTFDHVQGCPRRSGRAVA